MLAGLWGEVRWRWWGGRVWCAGSRLADPASQEEDEEEEEGRAREAHTAAAPRTRPDFINLDLRSLTAVKLLCTKQMREREGERGRKL